MILLCTNADVKEIIDGRYPMKNPKAAVALLL